MFNDIFTKLSALCVVLILWFGHRTLGRYGGLLASFKAIGESGGEAAPEAAPAARPILVHHAVELALPVAAGLLLDLSYMVVPGSPAEVFLQINPAGVVAFIECCRCLESAYTALIGATKPFDKYFFALFSVPFSQCLFPN